MFTLAMLIALAYKLHINENKSLVMLAMVLDCLMVPIVTYIVTGSL